MPPSQHVSGGPALRYPGDRIFFYTKFYFVTSLHATFNRKVVKKRVLNFFVENTSENLHYLGKNVLKCFSIIY